MGSASPKWDTAGRGRRRVSMSCGLKKRPCRSKPTLRARPGRGGEAVVQVAVEVIPAFVATVPFVDGVVE